MSGEKVVVTLDDFEQRLMVSGLADFRNDLIRDDKPTEDVDELILKVGYFGNAAATEEFFFNIFTRKLTFTEVNYNLTVFSFAV